MSKESLAPIRIQRRHSHTIMDGRVVRFAESFRDTGKGIIGRTYDAIGPFEISASRNCVVIHHASIAHLRVLRDFKVALDLAMEEHWSLNDCNGRPDDDDCGEPRDAEENQ